MRIMCLNGWGGMLADALLPYLGSTAPDVLCLQEVVHSPETHKAVLTYRDGAHILEQRANFFTELCEVLPDHIAMFCPAAQGVLWDGETPIPSQWGLATFVHRSIPVIGQIQGFVHKGFEPDGYGAHPRSRSAHGLRVFSGGRTISILHMHGLRDLRGKMDTPERRIQAERLLAMSDTLSEASDVRVICGDFNVEPGSETLSLLERAGFTELVHANGFSGTRSAHYTKPQRFADYMLINVPDAVQSFDVVERPVVSDHLPLVLDL